ncbi:MAG: PAC2 family protein [Candidatus Hecatellaceae archaeon]
MSEPSHCRVKLLAKPEVSLSQAVASSPGLRSVGWQALASLTLKLNPTLTAEVFSSDFPTRYGTVPSYFAKPRAYGMGGVIVESGGVSLPKVKVYHTVQPLSLCLIHGYHANFYGQYEVAEATVKLMEELGVKRLYILAGYALEGEPVCCAASTRSLLEEAEKAYGLKPGYVGPFLGFSGLLAGLAGNHGMEVLCLFGKTKPNPESPESPDREASEKLYRKICEILKVAP